MRGEPYDRTWAAPLVASRFTPRKSVSRLVLAVCTSVATVAAQERSATCYVRFVDVDSGAAVSAAPTTHSASVSIERVGDYDLAPHLWKFVVPPPHRSLEVEIESAQHSFLLPYTNDYSDPQRPRIVAFRPHARRALSICDEHGSVAAARWHTRVWFDLPFNEAAWIHDQFGARIEPSDAEEPMRNWSSFAGLWGRHTYSCMLGARLANTRLTQWIHNRVTQHVWIDALGSNETLVVASRDHAALDPDDLPRYAGAWSARKMTSPSVEVVLPARVCVRGRVADWAIARDDAIEPTLQLSIAELPYARAARSSVPPTPGTRARVRHDGSFEFDSVPPGPYWIGLQRDGIAAGPFERLDVPREGLDGVRIAALPSAFVAAESPREQPTRYEVPFGFTRFWRDLPSGDHVFHVSTCTFGDAPDFVHLNVRMFNPYVAPEVPSDVAWLTLRTQRERIAVVDVARARALDADPAQWPLEWQVPARVWLAWYGADEAARFDVRANGVLVERCWLEPGDVREITAPAGEIAVSTRAQSGAVHEQRASLAARETWIVREGRAQ